MLDDGLGNAYSRRSLVLPEREMLFAEECRRTLDNIGGKRDSRLLLTSSGLLDSMFKLLTQRSSTAMYAARYGDTRSLFDSIIPKHCLLLEMDDTDIVKSVHYHGFYRNGSYLLVRPPPHIRNSRDPEGHRTATAAGPHEHD
ncbi:hypothetical protein CORC01_13024 [Colletotrichum orchidophilum]|uniref:Uncharacterized protein n=1 Tax=Colletotrichum orchidophilum TaxID=1209926 RepID=A0A1G4AR84_9PEZI|nr:uncharacterized protein CORC01_13024 [Colletotrichum orchidophilum]OHE91678.1 hypothetical protein CORC01_13024 [Colletotrichum orchidophilum]